MQSFRLTLACSCAFALPFLLAASAQAASVTTACAPTKVKAVSSTATSSTTAGFVKVPSTTVKFTQGGSQPSCVLVTFFAMTRGEFSIDHIYIRGVIDGTDIGKPEAHIGSGETDSDGHAHTMEFVFPAVAPGHHTLQIEYKSGKGNHVTIFDRNTVVRFSP